MQSPTQIIVRTKPDALVKVYDEATNTVLTIVNTDERGETPPIKLDHGGNFYFDVTIY